MMKLILAAALAIPVAAQAATYGQPVFTTAPTDISVTNIFGDLTPTGSYQLALGPTTIASAVGAPDLVGQSLAMDYFFDGGFDDGSAFYALSIGGTGIVLEPDLGNANTLFVLPPFTEVMPGVFEFGGIFAAFGPRADPVFRLTFTLDKPIPTKTGYLYCMMNGPDCEFTTTFGGVTEIGGLPVTLSETIIYPEGNITGTRVIYMTEGGRPVEPMPPVPVPAAGLLLPGAIGALALLRRRYRRGDAGEGGGNASE